jgi:hypothetical protein
MEALSRLAAAPGFVPTEAATWSAAHAACFLGAVGGAFEFLSHAVPRAFAGAARIAPRGAHHDTLDGRDRLFLAINRAASVPFTYHYLKAAWLLPCMKWCAALRARTQPPAAGLRRGAG